MLLAAVAYFIFVRSNRPLPSRSAVAGASPRKPAAARGWRRGDRTRVQFAALHRLLAHRANSRQRSTSVAFGAKRTLTEPRLQKADL